MFNDKSESGSLDEDLYNEGDNIGSLKHWYMCQISLLIDDERNGMELDIDGIYKWMK